MPTIISVRSVITNATIAYTTYAQNSQISLYSSGCYLLLLVYTPFPAWRVDNTWSRWRYHSMHVQDWFTCCPFSISIYRYLPSAKTCFLSHAVYPHMHPHMHHCGDWRTRSGSNTINSMPMRHKRHKRYKRHNTSLFIKWSARGFHLGLHI